MNKLFDITFIRFIIVGCINTLVGTSVMFLSYNFLHFGYWISSALNYIIGSIVSYYLNKNYTFQKKTHNKSTIIRFIINISCCYIIAYGVAKPIVRLLLMSFDAVIQENVAMIVGMGLFVILNYIGQRFFAFK